VRHLSVILFNLVLDYIIKKSDIRSTSNIILQINAYVDDDVKISRNVEALEEALQELDNKAHQTEVTINQEKTKYMRVRRHIISVSA